MNTNLEYNMALAHWRDMLYEHGPEVLKAKLEDMQFQVQPDNGLSKAALRQALAEEGEE